MTISIGLSNTVPEIESMILESIAESINKEIKGDLGKIQLELSNNLIPKWINAQPELTALKNGELTGAFGITDNTLSIAQSIVDAVSSSVKISFKQFNKKLTSGGLDIEIQTENFSNLLSLPQGHTIYSGGDLHWLDWMLTKGDEIIIIGYEYNPQTGLGRTKLGNMVTGGGFRVPPQYSGTLTNNFVTRALLSSDAESDITKLIKKTLGV
jgi:hypothetical protein